MTLGIAIDPDTNRTAIAIFDLDDGATLLHAALLGGTGGCVNTLLEPVPETIPFFEAAPGAKVVIEKPQVYDRANQKGNQADLIKLAITVGALTQAASPFVPAVLHVEPRVWKGNVPKRVTEKRARAALTNDELSNVELPTAKGLRHNVWDAIGIGLWRWEALR